MAEQRLVLKPRTEMRPLTPEISCVLGGRPLRIAEQDAINVAYEHCAPVRTFTSWPGKRNYSGSYWSSTVGRHVGFESLFEGTALMTLDRDPTIVGISSQPMWINWPVGHTPKSHAPDYFVRHQNGDGEIIDVRPNKRIDEATTKVFEATRLFCKQAGFRYRVISELTPDLVRNLRFLSPYRHEAWAPPADALKDLASLRGAVTVVELARRLSPADMSRGLGQVYWLIWHNAPAASLNKPLSLRTQITI
jgi:hypothetical protein